MLRWMARRRLDAFEKTFAYDVSYMREMLDTSRAGFFRFSQVARLSQHREDVPIQAWYAAKMAATLAEDCGPCTQLVVTMAEKDGVSHAVLRGMIENDEAAMGPDAAIAWRFARAAMAHDPQADALREQIEQRWGRRAVLSLALALASSRMFPTVKYALGHGQACSRIRVGDAEARPTPRTMPA